MKDILRIASKLDESGQFKLSDKLMKIAQGILAAPQPSFGKPTAILAPPVIKPLNPPVIKPLNPPATTPINSDLCKQVTGVYSIDIRFVKNLIKDEINRNIKPLENGTRSYQFRSCVYSFPKYTNQQKRAFGDQCWRIVYDLSDTSKGNFYQIFYPLLKKYKLTENDLGSYNNADQVQLQFKKVLDELSKKLNIDVINDQNFNKSNEFHFMWSTLGMLIRRFGS
jgi:hypothetical protein